MAEDATQVEARKTSTPPSQRTGLSEILTGEGCKGLVTGLRCGSVVGKMAVQDVQSRGFHPHQDDGEITLGKCLEWSQMCMTCSVDTDSFLPFLPSLRP